VATGEAAWPEHLRWPTAVPTGTPGRTTTQYIRAIAMSTSGNAVILTGYRESRDSGPGVSDDVQYEDTPGVHSWTIDPSTRVGLWAPEGPLSGTTAELARLVHAGLSGTFNPRSPANVPGWYGGLFQLFIDQAEAAVREAAIYIVCDLPYSARCRSVRNRHRSAGRWIRRSSCRLPARVRAGLLAGSPSAGARPGSGSRHGCSAVSVLLLTAERG
jgi:hypothetical protein